MGTLIKVKLTDEFFESLFKKQDNSHRCIEGIPQEAKLLEIKAHGDDYMAVFQLPDSMEITPLFESRTF